MDGGDCSYPGVQLPAWKVPQERLHRIYFPANFLKLVTTPNLFVEQL